MSRRRVAAGVLVACALFAAGWLVVRERGGDLSTPHDYASSHVDAPTLLEGRGLAAEPPAHRQASGAAGEASPSESRDADAETSTIEGTVTGRDGKPAVGMAIFLVRLDEPVPPRAKGGMWLVGPIPARLEGEALGEWLPPGDAKTDATGHYSAKKPRGWDGVVVARVSSTYEVRSAPVSADEDSQRVDLRLLPPASLRVRLVSAGDRGARLQQLDVQGTYVWFSLQRDQEPGLREEDDGSVLVAEVTPGTVRVQGWIDSGPVVEAQAELVSGQVAEVRLEVSRWTGPCAGACSCRPGNDGR